MISHRSATPISSLLGCLFFAGTAVAQPPAPLYYIQTIPVPGWTNTGATQANEDIFGFNPYTHTL